MEDGRSNRDPAWTEYDGSGPHSHVRMEGAANVSDCHRPSPRMSLPVPDGLGSPAPLVHRLAASLVHQPPAPPAHQPTVANASHAMGSGATAGVEGAHRDAPKVIGGNAKGHPRGSVRQARSSPGGVQSSSPTAADVNDNGTGDGVTLDGTQAPASFGKEDMKCWTEEESLALIHVKREYDNEQELRSNRVTERCVKAEVHWGRVADRLRTESGVEKDWDKTVIGANATDTGVPFVPPVDAVEDSGDTARAGGFNRRKSVQEKNMSEVADIVKCHTHATIDVIKQVVDAQGASSSTLKEVVNSINDCARENSKTLSGALSDFARAFREPPPTTANAGSTSRTRDPSKYRGGR
ncbi:hypothetical protein CBR_g46448 [Chara braunii]|uniref:Myb-like domain-containing protein n=1 Tax=Chara braunii TaxID=69332 RepID=A0A388M0I1_CHABU|nr:hypothetical protein CBR_g46448 [Chara braunii]|eukprot:GBG88077.1 hypothetical protein CBR_g46448 [Chara braunii]